MSSTIGFPHRSRCAVTQKGCARSVIMPVINENIQFVSPPFLSLQPRMPDATFRFDWPRKSNALNFTPGTGNSRADLSFQLAAY